MSISGIGASSAGQTWSLSRLGAPRPPDASDFASKVLELQDKDGDGAISASESSQDSEAFTALDADGSGTLGTEELKTAFEKLQKELGAGPPPRFGPPPDAAQMVSDILAQEDLNEDGAISADESRLDADRFGKLDADGNGSLSAEELETAIAASQQSMPPPPPQESSESTEDAGGSLLASLRSSAIRSYADQSQLYSLLEQAAQLMTVQA